jgi:hypothetical protein
MIDLLLIAQQGGLSSGGSLVFAGLCPCSRRNMEHGLVRFALMTPQEPVRFALMTPQEPVRFALTDPARASEVCSH